ncbi:Glycosyltransferase, MGT family [Candidatus Desulfosporosinus infrequens]|uniref:Glycosyltransferase, MGT family n=1 Tax=Candidatus Desulfosporosinus infrequens TaxID=2043169 RepID=A0A2U3L9T3_9FIRM|nr:Glycosyltransferase, MGT family [Candidatus Desulfosporosinus infrequens]
MAKLLFINGPGEGHINPTLAVVEELVSRGEDVVYFATENFRERLENTGAIVKTYDGEKFYQAFWGGGGQHLLYRILGLLRTADIVIPSVLEQTKNECFDYIIHDSMFGCGQLLSQIMSLPAICSTTSFMQSRLQFDERLSTMVNSLPSHVQKEFEMQYQELRDSLKRTYEVEVSSPYDVFCNPALMTIVYTTKLFQPTATSFDDSYKFVGPSISKRFTAEPFNIAGIQEEKLIYISLGTISSNDALDFYRVCFDALGNTEYSIVLSIGRQTKIETLGPIPSNFMVKPYVPQIDLLQKTKLFITHGGMNSTSEALYYSVPLIVIPTGKDQPAIAQRVSELGAGVRLSMDGLTSTQLRDAVSAVFSNESYRRKAAEIGQSFQDASGYKQAVDEIENFKVQQGI